MFFDFSEPIFNVSESISASDIVNQQGARSPSVKLCGNALELLLSSGVIDLKLYIPGLATVFLSMILEFDHSRPEIDPNSQIVLGTESFVRELHKQAAFAHRGIADDNIFEEE